MTRLPADDDHVMPGRWSQGRDLMLPARGSADEAQWDSRINSVLSLIGALVMLAVSPLVVAHALMLTAGVAALSVSAWSLLTPPTAPRWTRSAYTAYGSVVILLGTAAAEQGTGLRLGAVVLLLPVITIACFRAPREVAAQAVWAVALDAAYLFRTQPAGLAVVGLVAGGTVLAMLATLICGLRARLDATVADLRRQAETDSLTGLCNRAGLRAALGRVPSPEGSLLLVDLDHFKRVNDELGHQAGDEVLVWFAVLLRSCADAADVVGRHGGEEFVVYLPGRRSRSSLAARAESLRECAEAGSRQRGLPLTVSIGAASGLATDLAGLLRAADRELYAAKNAGRNLVRVAA